MIHVIVFFDLHPGQREGFLAEFGRILPITLAEQGCIEYGVSAEIETGIDVVSPPHADRITLLEKWETLDALKTHLDAPHMQAFFPKVQPMIDSIQAFVSEPIE